MIKARDYIIKWDSVLQEWRVPSLKGIITDALSNFKKGLTNIIKQYEEKRTIDINIWKIRDQIIYELSLWEDELKICNEYLELWHISEEDIITWIKKSIEIWQILEGDIQINISLIKGLLIWNLEISRFHICLIRAFIRLKYLDKDMIENWISIWFNEWARKTLKKINLLKNIDRNSLNSNDIILISHWLNNNLFTDDEIEKLESLLEPIWIDYDYLFWIRNLIRRKFSYVLWK